MLLVTYYALNYAHEVSQDPSTVMQKKYFEECYEKTQIKW